MIRRIPEKRGKVLSQIDVRQNSPHTLDLEKFAIRRHVAEDLKNFTVH